MITINKNDLVKVSNRCALFIDKKPVLPALGSFKIRVEPDKIYITGSDQRSWITSSCPASGSTSSEEFCVPAIRFNAIMNVISQIYTDNESVTIDVKKTKIIIKSGDSKHDLPIMDAKEYPITTQVDAGSGFTDKGKVVNSIFRNMTKLVGNDGEGKSQLEGIYVQYDTDRQVMKMSGGNGSRFCLCSAYCTMPVQGFEPALIHHAAVRNMEKIFEGHSDICIKSNGKNVMIADHSTSIISRTIDEKFPDMWRLFNLSPKQANIKMSTTNLVQCINEARIHKSDINMIASMIINDDNVKLEMVNNEEASYSESYIKNVSGTFIPAKLGLHIDSLKEAIDATNSISVELVYGSNNGKTSGVIFNAIDTIDYGFETSVMLAVYKPSTVI